MLIDRSRFLKLTVAIAATTATTVACSAQTVEEEGDDTGAAASAGSTCNASSIRQPNAGTLKPYAFEEGFCFDLAVHEGPALRKLEGPTAEATTTRFFDFVYDQCRMYSNQLRPAVAEKVKSCLKKANDARPRNRQGVATTEFDAGKMYDCGRDALEAVCADGIDQRLSRTRCTAIARTLVQSGNAVDLRRNPMNEAKLETQCMAIFSGIKSSARTQIENCVKNDKYDMYTCVEGLRSDFELAEAAELDVAADLKCTPSATPVEFVGADTVCDDIVAKAAREHAEQGEFYVPEFTKKKCESYLSKFAPAMALDATECLLSPDLKTYDNIYTCGSNALKRACRDTSVDATCKSIVAEVEGIERSVTGTTKPTVNAGGRLTRQCRALLPGLKAEARTELKDCVGPVARSFAGSGLIKYAFYSCVEGL